MAWDDVGREGMEEVAHALSKTWWTSNCAWSQSVLSGVKRSQQWHTLRAQTARLPAEAARRAAAQLTSETEG